MKPLMLFFAGLIWGLCLSLAQVSTDLTAHFDNGWWKDGKGGIALLAGELEIGGLKIPARKLYFDAANLNFRLLDVFTTDTRESSGTAKK